VSKVKVPTLVNVCGKYYHIQYQENWADLHGEALLEKKIIKISTASHYKKDDLFATIFHETLHAVLYETGMASVIADSDKEEGIIRAIENSMASQVSLTSGIYSDFKMVELGKEKADNSGD